MRAVVRAARKPLSHIDQRVDANQSFSQESPPILMAASFVQCNRSPPGNYRQDNEPEHNPISRGEITVPRITRGKSHNAGEKG